MSSDGAASPSSVSASPAFKLVLLSVLAFTALSFVASIVLSLVEPSDNVDRVLETALTTWKLGFGALVGLFGGKKL